MKTEKFFGLDELIKDLTRSRGWHINEIILITLTILVVRIGREKFVLQAS